MADTNLFGPSFDYQRAIEFVKNKLGKRIGFPYELYENQRYALVEIFTAFASGQYDNVLVVAPTGSGKSGIAVGMGLAVADQSFASMVLTPTRQLQKQVVDSFKKTRELRSFKGQSNYPCALYEENGKPLRADTAPCTGYDTEFKPLENMRGASGLVVDPIVTDHADLDAEVTDNATSHMGLSTGALYGEMYQYSKNARAEWTGGHQMRLCTDKCLCPYRVARERASESPIAVLNLKGYFMWNTHAKESPFFKPRPFMIFDECHNIEDHARDFYALTITDFGLNELYKKVLGKSPKKYVEFRGKNVESPDFFRELYDINKTALLKNMESFGLKDKFKEYAEFAEEFGEDSSAARLIKYHKIFKLAMDPRANFAKALTFPESEEGKKLELRNPLLELTPVDLPQSFRDVYGEHNVFMSATIADISVFCRSTCLDIARTKVITLPDTFPVQNRPIIPWGVATASHKNIKENPVAVYKPIADSIGEIADAYPDHRILVHTNSYTFGKELSKYLSYKPCNTRVLCPHNGEENKQMIADYSDVKDDMPYILITPACREGYDFDGDLCRIQIFTRCPYPSLGDAVVKKKVNGPGGWPWYNAKTATAIRQMYGRSTRNDKDFSVTFLLDNAIIGFIRKCQALFPTEFHKAILLGERIDWRKLKITTELSVDGEKISY